MEYLDTLQLRLYRIKKSAEELSWMLHFYTRNNPECDKLDSYLLLKDGLNVRHDFKLPVKDARYENIFASAFTAERGIKAEVELADILSEVNSLRVQVGFLLFYWRELNELKFDFRDLRKDVEWLEWKRTTKDCLDWFKDIINSFIDSSPGGNWIKLK